MKRRGNLRTRKKLARLLAVLVASSMVLGSPNAIAFAEGNEVSEESLSGNSPAEKVSAAPTEEKEQEAKKVPVSEEASEEKKAEPKEESEASEKGTTDTKQVGAGESEPEKAPEEQGKSEAVQAFLAALDQIMELQENDAEAEEVLAAVEEAKKLYEALSEEEKALDEVKAGYEAIESFEGVNLLEEEQDGTEEHPWLVSDFNTLKNAIKKGGYIRLEQDVAIPDRQANINLYNTVIIDLNGYTLSSVVSCFNINNGDLTIIGNKGKIEVKRNDVFKLSSKSKLSLQGGTYTAGGRNWVIGKSSGDVIVDGGAVLTGGHGANIDVDGSITVKNGTVTGTKEDFGTIQIKGASVTVEEKGTIKSGENAYGIWVKGNSTVNVAGTVESQNAYGIYTEEDNEKNTLNIYPDAKVSSSLEAALGLKNANDEVNITGGDISGVSGIVISNGTLNVSGSKTKITGTIQDNVNVSDFSGAGIMVCGKDRNQIKVNVTVEDAEITGACAVYGKGGTSVTKSTDVGINLVSGKYTSTATAITGDYPSKAAVKFEKGRFDTECLSIRGGKYSGEAGKSEYPEYYGKYYDNKTYRLTEVQENGETYYEVAKIPTDNAEVDGIKYPTLQGAINAATKDSIVKLLNDLTESVTVSKEVVLDLNGKTLTNEDGEHTITVSKDGILTIKDGSGNGIVDNVSHQAAALYNEGIVTLNGGIFDRSEEAGRLKGNRTYDTEAGGNSWYTIENVSGTMAINDGAVVRQAGGAYDDAYGYKGFYSSLVRNGHSSEKDNIVTSYTKGTMVINGGEFYGGKMNVKNEPESTLTINGGHFYENLGYSVYNYGNTEIIGGTFVSWNNTVIGNGRVEYNDGGTNAGSSCRISGGTFTAVNKDGKGTRATTDNASGKKTIVTGGTFGNKYIDYGSSFLGDNPEYKRINIDGVWKVVRNDNADYLDKTDPDAVAQTANSFYVTLKEAIEAAGDGSVVTLLADVTECVTVDKKITLDLGGFTLTNVDGKGQHTITVESGGNLTVNGPGTVDNVSHQAAAILNEAGGFVQLNSGTYNRSKENGKTTDNSGDNSWYTIVNRGEMVIGDGKDDDTDLTILQNGSYSSMVRNGLGTTKDDKTPTPEDTPIAKMTINGGYFNHGKINVKNEAYGEVTINGGTFDCDRWGLVNYGKAVVKGGVFKGNNAMIYNGVDDLAGADKAKRGELKVEGGDFTYSEDRYCISDYAPEKTWITGGMYSSQKIYHDEVNDRELTSAVMPNQYGAVSVNGKYTVKVVPTSGGDNNSGSTDSGSGSGSSGSSSGNRSSSRDEILNPGGASPLLTPVPQQTAVTGTVAPTPGPTQPTATAPSPAPQPAEEPAQLEDENVPLAAAEPEEVKEKEEPEKVINIGDEEVPMAAPGASWAIMNLLLMLLTAAGAILTVVGSIRRREEEAEETGNSLWMVSLIPAICSAAVFVLTEKIGASIVIADRWTVTMLLIALAEGAVVFFVYRMMNKARDRA